MTLGLLRNLCDADAVVGHCLFFIERGIKRTV